MRRSLRVVVAALAVALAAAAPRGGGAAPATTAAIDAHDALERVKILSAPEMEGRGAATAGIGRAAAYVAGRFQEMGLAGGAPDGPGYFQAVDIPLPRRPAKGTALALGGVTLELGRDFAAGGAPGGARAVGGIVFAGYGIVVPGRYDDYAGIDARGKLVICLRYAPHYDRNTGQAADPAFTDGAALRMKVETAIEHGAVAVAIVDPPSADRQEAPGDERKPIIESLPALTPQPSPHPLVAPLLPELAGSSAGTNVASFHLGRAAANRLLATAGQSLAALRDRIDTTARPASLELPGYADFNVVWERASARTQNVLGLLEGSDPALRDEVVVVGAHYDHLGHGDEGSALGAAGPVYPGADDNASGTAAVLEIAEAFAARRPRPKRSILFAAFSGEERGLHGSAALAAHDLHGRRVVAMINLDMVGRMAGDKVEVGGGKTAPDWEAIVNGANSEKLALTFPARVVPNSDHASFLRKDVPSLFLFTGLHADYHRPTDTWDKVNADGLAKTARLAFRIAQAVADRDQRLAFVAPEWTRMGAVGGAHGGVRLGIMPDYQSDDGLRVSAVMAGSAAEGAGLVAGDVIKDIGGKAVRDIGGYMEALAAFHGGDETVVRVLRGSGGAATTLELKVRFRAAAEGSEVKHP